MPAFPQIIDTNIDLVVSDKNSLAIKDLMSVSDVEKIVYCGGVVISQYLRVGEMKDINNLGENDIDILAPNIEDILTSKLNEKFDISHIHDYNKKMENYHHLNTPHDKFFVGLIHKETNVKIHCFDYKPFDPIIINKFNFNNLKILARSAEDQAVTKLLEITRIRGSSLYELKNGPILGFKYLIELINLLTVCDPYKVQYIWHNHPTRIANGYGGFYYDDLGNTINYALQNKNIIAKTNPKKENVPDKVAGEESKSQSKCPECIFDYSGFKIKEKDIK